MGTYLMKIGTGNVYDYWFSWTENSQNIDSNVTNLTVKLYLKRNDGYANSSYRAYNDLPISLSVDGSVRYSTSKANIDTRNSKTVELASWTGNISHNADGTRSVPLEGYFRFPSGTTLSGAWTISTTITLTTIPRASSPSCVTYPNHTQDVGDIGGTITIHMNRASSSFTHTVRYSWASKNATIGTGVTDNVKWTIPMDFCSDIPSSVGGSGTITVDTYSGSTYIGSKSISFYAHVPASVIPTISSVSISEATAGLATKFGGYVLSKSKLAVSITAGGAYGSTVSKYETRILGVTYYGSSFTSNVLTQSGTVDVTVTVYDSRGASCTHTEQISVMGYAPPTIIEFSAWRVDDDGNVSDQGERLAVKMAYTVSSLDGKNDRTYDLKYGVSGSSLTSFSNGTANASYSGTQTFTSSPVISADNTYVVSLALSDYFGTTIENISIPTGFVLMDSRGTGRGIAFGKVSEKDAFEVSMKAEFGDQVGFVKEMTCLSPAHLSGGQWVHTAAGNVGTRSFIKFVEITVLNIYVNTGISFDIIHRGDPYPSRVNIQFENVGNTDPNVVAFTVYGSNNGVWIKKETTSTWGIYVYMNDAYDRIDVVGFAFPAYMQYGVSVNFVDVAADNVDGATQATIGTMKVNASNAISADSAKFADLLTGFVSRPSDQTWGVQTGTYVSGMNDSTGGSVAWRRDCPSGGQLSMVIDGLVYVAEGAQRVLHTGDVYGNFERRSDGSAGGYIKIGDYQICFGWLYFNIAVSTATGNSYYGVWEGTHNYARAFGDTPAVTLTVNSDLIKSTSLITSNATGFSKVQLFDSRSRTAQGWYVYYVAVGKA